MKPTTKAILEPVLLSDPTVTDLQRDGAIACLEGKPAPTLPELMKQTDVAHTLNISRQSVWAMVKKGQLKPVKLSGGLIRYQREQVMNIVKHGVEVEANS